MIRRSVAFVALVTVVVVTLAGCAAAPATTASATHAARVEPTPTPSAAAQPGWPFSIRCAEILSLDDARTLTGAELAITRDESTPAAGVYDTAIRQGGALQCGWSTSSTQSNGLPIGSLTVNVLPDATESEQNSVVAAAHVGGDASDPCDQGQCWHAGSVSGNAFEIGWITAVHAHDADGGESAFAVIEAEITNRLTDPGKRAPRWTPPAGPKPETFCDKGQGREQFIPQIATALGLDAGALVSAGGVGGDPGVIGASVSRTDVGECAWASTDSDRVFAGVWILAGGAWNLDAWRAATPDARDASDPGHPGAFVFDDGHGNFALAFASAGSLVEVDYSQTGLSIQEAPERMIAVAKALQL